MHAHPHAPQSPAPHLQQLRGHELLAAAAAAEAQGRELALHALDVFGHVGRRHAPHRPQP